MRDVVKTNVKREQNRKRKRRRRRHTSIYFFLVLLMVTGIGILLSVTLFFNVKAIKVEGDVDYTNDDVIRMSGIKVGDNLIRLDSEKASEGILLSMIYIETAEIDKQYPGTIEIKVSKCIPTAIIESKSGYLVVSANGKILEKKAVIQDELFTIKGYETLSDKPGDHISSNDKQATEIVNELLKECGKYDGKITSIDVTDKFDITVNYENRITFKMGNSNDIPYKLNLAGTVLEEISKNKKGIMTMAGANQISFRESGSNLSLENENKIPVPTEKTQTATEAVENQTEAEYVDYGYSENEYQGDIYYEEDSYEEQYYEGEYGY